jgi:outer membrane protein OmpA-like peptidoglycan-associated protein
MRILITGFLLFAIWAALSTYLWVNKIKDFSPEPVAKQVVIPAPPKAVMPEKVVVYFASDKSDLKADAIAETLIEGFKAWLAQNPDSKISITGHADATGSKKHNIELGNKRAQVVRDFFTAKGITPDKIILDSKGEEEPAADNKTKEGRTKNRRSEIIIK